MGANQAAGQGVVRRTQFPFDPAATRCPQSAWSLTTGTAYARQVTARSAFPSAHRDCSLSTSRAARAAATQASAPFHVKRWVAESGAQSRLHRRPQRSASQAGFPAGGTCPWGGVLRLHLSTADSETAFLTQSVKLLRTPQRFT